MDEATSKSPIPDTGVSFSVKYMSAGKHSVFLYLPQALHSHIGLIIAHWGNFEVTFDHCLGALIEAEAERGIKRESKQWKTRSFRRRRQLFRDICKEWPNPRKPEVVARLLEILDSSSRLHWKRTMIAHGNYGYTIPPFSSVAKDCFAFMSDKKEKMYFDEAVLQALHHDISHLTADLVIAFSEIAKIEGLPFALVPDSEVLRIYRDTIHPWNPDPAKRPDNESNVP